MNAHDFFFLLFFLSIFSQLQCFHLLKLISFKCFENSTKEKLLLFQSSLFGCFVPIFVHSINLLCTAAQHYITILLFLLLSWLLSARGKMTFDLYHPRCRHQRYGITIARALHTHTTMVINNCVVIMMLYITTSRHTHTLRHACVTGAYYCWWGFY